MNGGSNLYTKSVSDWKPTPPDKSNLDKLMGTVAHDNPDTVAPTNELKQYMGSGSAKSEGPFGRRGRNF